MGLRKGHETRDAAASVNNQSGHGVTQDAKGRAIQYAHGDGEGGNHIKDAAMINRV